MKARLNNTSLGIESLLWQATRRADLITAVAEGDLQAMQPIFQEMVKHSIADFITVTDGQGTVLLRTHSDNCLL